MDSLKKISVLAIMIRIAIPELHPGNPSPQSVVAAIYHIDGINDFVGPLSPTGCYGWVDHVTIASFFVTNYS
jgi:hypothetical protein